MLLCPALVEVPPLAAAAAGLRRRQAGWPVGIGSECLEGCRLWWGPLVVVVVCGSIGGGRWALCCSFVLLIQRQGGWMRGVVGG